MKEKESNCNNDQYTDSDSNLYSSSKENNYYSDSSVDYEELNHIKINEKDKLKRKRDLNPKVLISSSQS